MERASDPPWQARPGKVSPWTDEQIARLRTRWSQGASAREISRDLGNGISRDSVLGKIHRLGIAELSPNGAGRGGRPPEDGYASARGLADHFVVTLPREQHPRPAWVTRASPHVDDPLIDADIPFSRRCSFLGLSSRTCRWPVGDPGKCDFFFCGAKPVQGKPYCAAHCVRAYRPAQETAQRSPSARLRRSMLRFRGMDTYIKLGGETAAERRFAGEGE